MQIAVCSNYRRMNFIVIYSKYWGIKFKNSFSETFTSGFVYYFLDITKSLPYQSYLQLCLWLSPNHRFLITGQTVKNNFLTRNTCMQQPLALIGVQGTIFSEHEVFRVYDFEIVFIFTLVLITKYIICTNFLVSNTINILIYCQIWYKIGSITPNTKMFWNIYIKLKFLPIKFQDIHYFHECSFAFVFISNLLIF